MNKTVSHPLASEKIINSTLLFVVVLAHLFSNSHICTKFNIFLVSCAYLVMQFLLMDLYGLVVENALVSMISLSVSQHNTYVLDCDCRVHVYLMEQRHVINFFSS